MTESRPGAATSFMSHMRHKTGRRNQNVDMSIWGAGARQGPFGVPGVGDRASVMASDGFRLWSVARRRGNRRLGRWLAVVRGQDRPSVAGSNGVFV